MTFSKARLKYSPNSLYILGFIFILLNSFILTLSPAVRERSWDVAYRWSHWIGTGVWLSIYFLLAYVENKKMANANRFFLPLIGLLSGWGMLMIWRLDSGLGERQAIWIMVCGAMYMIGLLRIRSLSFFREFKYIWLTSGLLLTGLTLFFGSNPLGYGPRLWLGCCGVYFQPSEPLKLLLIIFLASFFADRQPIRHDIRALLVPALMMIGLTTVILLAQQDMGTGLVFVLIFTGVIYSAIEEKRVLGFAVGGLLAAGTLGYFLFDLLQIRIEGWINPWIDPSGDSYQIVQSLISASSGGILGRGMGIGNPGLVPIAHSDFIFSAIVEESGLLGGLSLIAIFTMLVIQGLKTALHASNRFDRYMAVGISTYLACQSILIIGGNIKALPLTGIPLPFVSYGGSSLLTSFGAVFILAFISQDSNKNKTYKEIPIRTLGNIFLAGFGTLSLVLGWWTVVRASDLIDRTDNARRAISDRYVIRGSIYDRNQVLLTTTIGLQGDYQRVYYVPEASPVLGYTSPVYGQAGAETSLDRNLRGLENQSAWTIWTQYLLFGQSPPGLDIQVSLDTKLQKYVVDLLGDKQGAVVIMNAENGEILSMVSTPFYDPNQLDEKWNEYIIDPDSPLLNRAAQGSYQPGPILGPFMLTLYSGDIDSLLPEGLALDVKGNDIHTDAEEEILFSCARSSRKRLTWAEGVQRGCPGALINLDFNEENFANFIAAYRFNDVPSIKLPVAAPSVISKNINISAELIGQGAIQISPLQLAFAAASLSNHGKFPSPHILTATEQPDGSWEKYLPPNSSNLMIPAEISDKAALSLQANGRFFWEATALAIDGDERVLSWYTGGSLPGETGIRYAVVVLIEEKEIGFATEVGQQILLKLQETEN